MLSQSYKNIEYIIIDGGSTDGTLEIIRKFQNSIQYWVSENDDGVYDAMNKGFLQTKGDYIFFLNANDYFLSPDVVTKFISYINNDSIKSDFYYGNIEILSQNTNVIRRPRKIKELLFSMPFCHQAVFSSSVFLRNNPFSLKYKLASDFALFREAYIGNRNFTYLDIDVCHYDLNGVSQNKFIYYLKEILLIILRQDKKNINRLILSLWGLLLLNYKFLIKYSLSKIGLKIK